MFYKFQGRFSTLLPPCPHPPPPPLRDCDTTYAPLWKSLKSGSSIRVSTHEFADESYMVKKMRSSVPWLLAEPVSVVIVYVRSSTRCKRVARLIERPTRYVPPIFKRSKSYNFWTKSCFVSKSVAKIATFWTSYKIEIQRDRSRFGSFLSCSWANETRQTYTYRTAFPCTGKSSRRT